MLKNENFLKLIEVDFDSQVFEHTNVMYTLY